VTQRYSMGRADAWSGCRETPRGEGVGLVTIVMGLDQHRAQITAEWIDLATGEISRARVRPADRAGARRFLSRFRGLKLEVALEATTGWRFLVEELRAIGAVVHLAEPAETAARRGTKKRPKTDRADARHHRELLMAGRLPESWIPPDHILDLRAQVRLRHTLIEQHSEWQQRIQAVLYHHGCPQRRKLMTSEGRDWLAAQPLPEAARQQITVSLQMIDFLDLQLAPLTKELRAWACRQAGCRALIEAHYGIGELCAVTILAELGDCTRSSSSSSCAGRCSKQPRRPARKRSPDHAYYTEAAERLGHNRACLSIARKLLKRCYHTLRELGEEALAPPADERPMGGSGAARRASSGSPSRLKRSATCELTDELAA
jgi:transposase